MRRNEVIEKKLVDQAMQPGARVGLTLLLEHVFSVDEIREMATAHGLSPKGFRVERAPISLLLPLLLDPKTPAILTEICGRLLERIAPRENRDDAADPDRLRDLESLATLRAAELLEAREDLASARETEAEGRRREAELRRRLEEQELATARLRADIEHLIQQQSRRPHRVEPRDEDADKRLRELERENESLNESERELRRLVALRQARIRELDEKVAELLERLPKDKRERREAPSAPLLAEEFRLPYFLPSFYKSLDDKDRRSIEKAVQAALLFCTEGHSYPGLEVKAIEGQDVWSLRASLRLRVYFRFRPDGDVEFLALADREDQPTMLRRIKEW